MVAARFACYALRMSTARSDLPETDIPQILPEPPEQAGAWSADRLGPDGWETLSTPPGRGGGPATRWHDLPCDVGARWGAGVYRVHWRTGGRRPLGTSEPFRVLSAEQPPPPPPQPRPEAKQAAPPRPTDKPADLSSVADTIAAVLQAKAPGNQAKTPNPPPNIDPITAWDVMEQRAHERNRELAALQQQGWAMVAQIQAKAVEQAFALAQDHRQRTDQLYAEHTARLDALRKEDATQQDALRSEFEDFKGALATQLEELATAEPDEAPPTPETFQDKIKALVQMITTPEGQQVLGMVQQLLSQGKAPPQEQPLGQLPDGGSLPE